MAIDDGNETETNHGETGADTGAGYRNHRTQTAVTTRLSIEAGDLRCQLYIQNETPGKELESNWLPAPKGPFAVYMRLYWPKEAAMDGSWKAPKAEVVK